MPPQRRTRTCLYCTSTSSTEPMDSPSRNPPASSTKTPSSCEYIPCSFYWLCGCSVEPGVAQRRFSLVFTSLSFLPSSSSSFFSPLFQPQPLPPSPAPLSSLLLSNPLHPSLSLYSSPPLSHIYFCLLLSTPLSLSSSPPLSNIYLSPSPAPEVGTHKRKSASCTTT